MGRQRCPHCSHEPFKTENGLRWHLKYIHGQMDYPQSTTGRLAESTGQNSLNHLEARMDSRFNIHIRRDEWLSDRIRRLEEAQERRQSPE